MDEATGHTVWDNPRDANGSGCLCFAAENHQPIGGKCQAYDHQGKLYAEAILVWRDELLSRCSILSNLVVVLQYPLSCSYDIIIINYLYKNFSAGMVVVSLFHIFTNT